MIKFYVTKLSFWYSFRALRTIILASRENDTYFRSISATSYSGKLLWKSKWKEVWHSLRPKITCSLITGAPRHGWTHVWYFLTNPPGTVFFALSHHECKKGGTFGKLWIELHLDLKLVKPTPRKKVTIFISYDFDFSTYWHKFSLVESVVFSMWLTKEIICLAKRLIDCFIPITRFRSLSTRLWSYILSFSSWYWTWVKLLD